MEIGITVSPLINKLRKLLDDHEFTDPETNKVNQLIDMLKSLLDISADVEDRILPFRELSTVILHDVYTAEDIVDAFILTREVQRRKLTDQFRLNQLNYSDQLGSTISHLHKVLEIFRELLNGDLSDQIVLTGGARRWENIPSYLDEAPSFVGLENEMADLVERLLTLNSRVIPVVGVAGSGKTTLVRKIYNRVDIKKHFECRAWVNVSSVDIKQRFEVRNLSAKEKEEEQKNLLAKAKEQERNLWADIVKQVMVMTKEQSLSNEELKGRLSAFLEKKRYLIVLDGVRTTDVWDRLKQALPADAKNGSKIILTTVYAYHVAQQANPKGSPFQLRLLTDEESWALFWNKVKKSDIEMADIIHLREEILRTCNGIPLAILLLGGLLSTMNLSQWSRVIGHPTFGKYQSVPGIVALSYRGLPSELKSCLLCMCLFPREYEIPVRRLLGLWIAENRLRPSLMEGRVIEDVARIYINELVGRNMIEAAKCRSDGSPKTCHMPGIIYDFLLPKALDMGFLCVCSNFKNSVGFKVKRFANYLDIERYPSNPDIQSLRSYVSSDIRKRGTPAVGIGMLLIKITEERGFGLLTVLDLEGVYKPVLPKALGKLLVLLRCLGLRSTVLDSIPASVGELQWLETLDVKHTNITNLPSSILKGKKLRHLYLNGINLELSNEQQSSGSVGDLQTLSGISIDSEGSIRNGLNRFTGLRKLGLTCHSTVVEAVVEWISKLTNLRTLKLMSVETFLEPSNYPCSLQKLGHSKLSHLYLHGKADLPECPQNLEILKNLEILTLSLSSLGEYPMSVLGELPHLKTLRLLAKSYTGKQMNCNSGSFPQLRILKLWMLEELEEWKIEEKAMPCLRELEIRRCKKLKKPDGLEHLANLKELILTNMEEDFAADIKGSMGSDVFINIKDLKQKLSDSDLWFD